MRALFGLTILINAFLLFLVQPMIARMLLPFLGGSPAVWNTCMVFFQAMLLAGYAYSHYATTRLRAGKQVPLHLGLMLLSALVFPLSVAERALGDPAAWPILWLLGTLCITVGPPFLMLSTGSSLLQYWFSKTGDPRAGDPYFLYVASNIGSLLALLLYPIAVEPRLRLREQRLLWMAGYFLLTGLLAVCARYGWNEAATSQNSPAAATVTGHVPAAQRMRWIALSFAPSSLMLGVTTFLTTDISPIPFLWVLPLAIYLLTYILAFAQRQVRGLTKLVWTWLPIYSILIVFLILMRAPLPAWLQIMLHLLMLFYAALLCHARLAGERPDATHLTEYYLWIALGGVLGGVFNSLLAPMLFNGIAEYPLAIVLALMLRRPVGGREGGRGGEGENFWLKSGYSFHTKASLSDFIFPAALGLLTLGLAIGLSKWGLSAARTMVASLVPSLLISYAASRKPIRFGLAIGAIVLGTLPFGDLFFGRTLFLERNFFGLLRVTRDAEGKVRNLFHGNTSHGKQFIDPRRECEPLAYYHRNGPIGQAIDAFGSGLASQKIAVIGLGTGAMASYAKAGQHWTFYELDPAVIRLAETSGHFSYLRKCAQGAIETVAGDARLQLQRAPDKHFALIALDAFSSDAIPTHLLTLEAMNLYLSKMADGGRLALHLSNKYIDLPPIVGDLALRLGLVCLVNDELKPSQEGESAALWVVLARRPEDLGSLLHDPRWRRLEGRADAPLWTDDYSNVFGAIHWR